MSDWKVIDKDPSVLELYAGMMTFGRGKHRYIVENTETGERRVIFADDADDLGHKIASGDFDEGQWAEQRPPREKKEMADRETEGMSGSSRSQSTGTRRSRGRSRSSGPDDDRPGCWGCRMASLVGGAICIVVMVTGLGPPFFDHLMLIFFAFCALVSHMGCKLQTSTTSEKIVFGISVVVGLVCWLLTCSAIFGVDSWHYLSAPQFPGKRALREKSRAFLGLSHHAYLGRVLSVVLHEIDDEASRHG